MPTFADSTKVGNPQIFHPDGSNTETTGKSRDVLDRSAIRYATIFRATASVA